MEIREIEVKRGQLRLWPCLILSRTKKILLKRQTRDFLLFFAARNFMKKAGRRTNKPDASREDSFLVQVDLEKIVENADSVLNNFIRKNRDK